MKSTVPIFIVSLKKDIERRNNITNALSAQNLSWTVIDAIEGKNLQPDYLESLNYQYSGLVSANEVACSLSHQSIYKKIINSDTEWALILEDDAIIDEQLSGLIEQLESEKTSLLRKKNIYLLGGQEGLISRNRISLSLINTININNIIFRKVTYTPNKISRACCYLIHRDECKKLIDLFDEYFYVADAWGLFHKFKIVNEYFLTEIVKHPIVSIENSNLEKDRIEISNRLKKSPRRKKGNIETKIDYLLLQTRRLLRSLKF
ncbi:glycosyltransferase family 25 protein [Providencia burhodogranariea]|uniref:Beta1,4-galactosyltransferase WaaX n=1 Tax=Providencia burhodogranariea DSM 19968 TaxID=1141662 RepID=K8WD53_9GAMM|nr:glycosyltransferase family 25 protein [Providencia burhodogranariea]EKT54170.1 beta1,4-galactosyltransferase WaaX [Providencia burhodogranariea DSM 19968]